MFINDDDLEEEDLEDMNDADIAIVPMSILPSPSEGSQVLQSSSTPRGAFGDSTPRSSQYNERMARARQQKLADKNRRMSNTGMFMSNDMPSRPGTASAAPIDVINQEVEEMELEDDEDRAIAAARARQSPEDDYTRRRGSTPQAHAAGCERSASMWSESSYEQEIHGSMSGPAQQQHNGAMQQQQMQVSRPAYMPAVIDTSDLRAFLMRPGPVGAMVQCYIQRKKSGMSRLFPTYEIYLKEGDKFLLAARKRKKNKSSNYLISLDKDDLNRASGNFFGKLRSNFIGTEFTLYDKGLNPEKSDDGKDLVQIRQELACVLYKQNVLGSRGPRKMKVMVPNVNARGERTVLRPQSTEETMLERYKAAMNDADVQILKNKPPKWNEQVGAYVLNFNGRVTRASVKNFQLYNPAKDAESVIMQFGRVGKDAFTMDYQAPLCALQAFGIALSSFDYKIACE
uniref:Tubby C-terminal domain-containing protein n=1 Tax=Coccolithus braarudii TaxID=221442 RepID=A0A7S0LEN7_9EUKA